MDDDDARLARTPDSLDANFDTVPDDDAWSLDHNNSPSPTIDSDSDDGLIPPVASSNPLSTMLPLTYSTNSPSSSSANASIASALTTEEFDEFDDSAQPPGVYLCKTVDHNYKVYRWKIERFSALRDTKAFSDVFEVGGFPWRIMLFPRGNNSPHLSVYIEVADAAQLKAPWSRRTKFMLGVVHPDDYRLSKHMEAPKLFMPEETDWGFRELVPLDDLKRKYLRNDTLIIEATIDVEPPKATAIVPVDAANQTTTSTTMDIAKNVEEAIPYVGLKNQGATCYMNSLLQTLYHLAEFRRIVYGMPTDIGKEDSEKSVPLALQRVFYQLQCCKHAVGTKQLTKSFGWDTVDSFMQHDVQEFSRVLLDNLETKMKGTRMDGAIERLLRGRMKNYIRCLNVDFSSTRLEDFYDVQLNVRDCKTIYDSFRQYVEVERLEGDNKYHAEGHGKQDAEKGVIFDSLPQVLFLQLKRFTYDYQLDRMYKVNDRFEFYPEINLSEFTSSKDPDAIYELYAVLVHAGDVHGGHYYAFVRPQQQGGWFRFDDDLVTAVPQSEALDENFGGSEKDRQTSTLGGMAKTRRFQTTSSNMFRRYANAYMLVYVRKSQEAQLLQPVTQEDIPEHLRRSFDREIQDEEVKRKEKDDAHMYAQVAVLTRSDLQRYHGVDLVDHSDPNKKDKNASTNQNSANILGISNDSNMSKKDGAKSAAWMTNGLVEPLRILRTATFGEFKNEVAARTGIPAERQRMWQFEVRQNETFRPDSPVLADDRRPVEKVLSLKPAPLVSYTSSFTPSFAHADLRWIFVDDVAESHTPLAHDEIMIFFKHYDPLTQELSLVREMPVRDTCTIASVADVVRGWMHWDASTSVVMYEEVRLDRIDLLSPDKSLRMCNLQSGDVIVFQRTPASVGVSADSQFAYAERFLSYLATRTTVKILPLSEPESANPLELELNMRMTYEEVAAAVGRALSKDPAFIRFTSYSVHSRKPRPDPIKSTVVNLKEMLMAGSVTVADRLFWEELEMPLKEMETKKAISLQYCDLSSFKLTDMKVYVQVTAHVRDVLDEVKRKMNLPADTPLRLLQISSNTIRKVWPADERVDILDHYMSISYRVEVVPEDQRDLVGGARLMPVCHGERSKAVSLKAHGVPFMYRLDDTTTASQIIDYAAKRMDVSPEEVAKWKLCLQAVAATFVVFEPNQVVKDEIDRQPANFPVTVFIERKDTDKKASLPSSKSFEREIKIYN